jgi:hypothetical protein
VPDRLDPVLVTVALDAAAARHVPRRAHEVLHSVTVITNSLWLKYFPEREGIKGQAREVVAAICENLDAETARVDGAAARRAAARARVATLHARLAAEVDAVNAAEEVAERWRERFRFTKQRAGEARALRRTAGPATPRPGSARTPPPPRPGSAAAAAATEPDSTTFITARPHTARARTAELRPGSAWGRPPRPGSSSQVA